MQAIALTHVVLGGLSGLSALSGFVLLVAVLFGSTVGSIGLAVALMVAGLAGAVLDVFLVIRKGKKILRSGASAFFGEDNLSTRPTKEDVPIS